MDTESFLRKLESSDLNVDKFVKELSQKCVGGQELQKLRNKIHVLNEKTSHSLKKNVYENYMQFIDTAKEISHLESEMYQLSHMLTEQRSLLNELATSSILEKDTFHKESAPGSPETQPSGDKTNDDEVRRQKLMNILDKVENCMSLLDNPTRILLHEGDLLELDSLTHSALRRMHAYLFNDSFMLTSWISERRGPMRYKFEAMFDICDLAIVNVRDTDQMKYIFRLLAFPDNITFQCSSNTSKKEWLEKFDVVKKLRTAHEKKPDLTTDKSPSRHQSIDSPSESVFLFKTDTDHTDIPEWLSEAPEEFDILLAQRHFDETLDLIERVEMYLSANETEHVRLAEIRAKMDARKRALIDALLKELEMKAEKSLQGGVRSARRAVRLLKKLGETQQACRLFLTLCSNILKLQYKRVKRDGSISVYNRHLAALVFTEMAKIAEEFLKSFADSSTSAASFTVWVNTEVTTFMNHIIKQLFHEQTTIAILADCICALKAQAQNLHAYGINVIYQIDGTIRMPFCRALRDCKEKLVDTIRVKVTEDQWRPTNFGSASELNKFVGVYADMGLDLTPYITGDTWLELATNTIYFIKMYVNLVDDCLKLTTRELQFTLDEALFDVFQAQLKNMEVVLIDERKSDVRPFIIKNMVFLRDILLPLVEHRYRVKVGCKCDMLSRLKDEFCHIRKPNVSSIAKYSSAEYL